MWARANGVHVINSHRRWSVHISHRVTGVRSRLLWEKSLMHLSLFIHPLASFNLLPTSTVAFLKVIWLSLCTWFFTWVFSKKALKSDEPQQKKSSHSSCIFSVFQSQPNCDNHTNTILPLSPLDPHPSRPLPHSPHSIKLYFCHKSINIIREWQTMGWWRQPLSVKAQTALSLSQPGREGQEETATHTHARRHTHKQTHK